MARHDDAEQDIALLKATTIKTDPSVKVTDTYNKGEPRGSVPLAVTMRKPQAYDPKRRGPR